MYKLKIEIDLVLEDTDTDFISEFLWNALNNNEELVCLKTISSQEIKEDSHVQGE